jgi:ABC-type Fe3+ transport system substrate-binding protein
MTTATIDKDMTVQTVLERWPQTLDVFIANGFDNFRDEKRRSAVAPFLKLERAAATKNYDLESFLGLLRSAITEEHSLVDVTMKQTSSEHSDITVSGLLPCPVRLPLLEGFDAFIEDYSASSGFKVSYRLEAASVGADWIEQEIKTIDTVADLPDIFVSAGFEAFFDQKTIGRFKDQGTFCDISTAEVNADFDGIDIRDPKGDYSIIAAVPAVFMINHEVLGDLQVPRSWSDLLKPEYERQVALPVGDFDLFNAILLNIYKEHGEAGVKKLGRSMLKSMHPSQMVKNAKRVAEEKPIITIMPYFFTKMASMVDTLEIIWPEDGAIVSPIFMLTKKSNLDKTRPVAEFFGGKQIGELLAQRGLFPSLHPQVDNRLNFDHPWKWIGWDYIYQQDIGELIQRTNKIFESAMNAS